MNCRHIRPYLVPFLKGALDAPMADRVSAHLAECAPCAGENTYLEPAVALLAPMRLVAAQTDQGRLIEMVQAQASQVLPHSRRRAWGWAVAAIATAALAAALIVSRQPRGTPGNRLALAGTALRPGDVGMIAQTFGAPRIRTAEAQWRTAKQYAALRVGHELRTERDQALDLWFTDGSRMRIGPNTRIALLPPGKIDGRPVTVALDRGSASVAVMKAKSRFAVRTPAATAIATGTRFGLDVAQSGRTNLAVFSGSVTFSNASGTVTAAGPVRTTAAAGSAPDQPVSIGMSDLLEGAAGVLLDDFNTPPLNEAVWIPHAIDKGVLITQGNGRLTVQGTPRGNAPQYRARLLTYFFPCQDFSAAVSFRMGADAQGGACLDIGWGRSMQGGGVQFKPDKGYAFLRGGSLPPFGDERQAFHRLRLDYNAATRSLTGYVDDRQIGQPVKVSAPYLFLGFGATSAKPGVRINLEFDDFEATFGGGVSVPAAAQPLSGTLAARTPGVVLDVGPPDAWDGQTVYNPSVLRRGDHFEMWYAADPPDGCWRQARIGLAYSNDGVTWQKYRHKPVINDQGSGAPCVLYRDWGDGRRPYYKMWYRYFHPSYLNQGLLTRIAYATSRDGIHWERHGVVAGEGPEWRDHYRVSSPSVLYLPDVPDLPAPYLLYYYAEDNQVRLAISQDGVHWQPQGPVLSPSAPGGWDSFLVGDGHVVYAGGKFHLFYTGYGSDPRIGSAIGYAVSDDGVHWRRGNYLAVAGSNDPGSFDYGLVQPAPLVDGDKVRVWYTCGPYSGIFGFWGHNIGYAQIPVASLSR